MITQKPGALAMPPALARSTLARDEREDVRVTALTAALGLAAFLLALYLATYSGVPHNPDEWFFLSGAESAVTGDLVQAHGRLFSLLLAPLYALPRLIDGTGSYQSAAFFNSLITALTAGVLFMTLRLVGVSVRGRLTVALIYGAATFAWVYSRYLFREPLVALFLLLACYFLLRFRRRPAVAPLVGAGLAFAAAALTKETALAFAPFCALLVAAPFLQGRIPAALVAAWNRGPLVPLAALAAAVIAPTLVLVPLARVVGGGLPEYVAGWPRPAVFTALLVSPGWGLLNFNPALWLAVIGALPFLRRHPAPGLALIGGSLFYLAESTTHPVWWGAWGFGPRQLLPITPLLCLLLPEGIHWLREHLGRWGAALAVALVAVSAAFTLVGVLTPFNAYVREVLFPAGIVETDLTWRWSAWPVLGMARFLQPAVLDVAWVQQRSAAAPHISWTLLAPLLAFVGLTGGWLILLRRRWRHIGAWALAGSAALLVLAAPLALLTLQRVYADERYNAAAGYEAAANWITADRRPGDVVVTDLWTERPYELATALTNYCAAGCPPRIDLLRAAGDAEAQRAALSGRLEGFDRAWLVLEGLPPGSANSPVEQALNAAAYLERCEWTGPQVRVCRYDVGAGRVTTLKPPQARFGGGILLHAAVVSSDSAAPYPADRWIGGDTVRLAFSWQAETPQTTEPMISVQLLSPAGAAVSVIDRPLTNGFRPAATWQAGELITDRHAIPLSDALPAGEYTLAVVLYDPQTLQRLPVAIAGDPGRAVGDLLVIARLNVASAGGEAP